MAVDAVLISFQKDVSKSEGEAVSLESQSRDKRAADEVVCNSMYTL